MIIWLLGLSRLLVIHVECQVEPLYLTNSGCVTSVQQLNITLLVMAKRSYPRRLDDNIVHTDYRVILMAQYITATFCIILFAGSYKAEEKFDIYTHVSIHCDSYWMIETRPAQIEIPSMIIFL